MSTTAGDVRSLIAAARVAAVPDSAALLRAVAAASAWQDLAEAPEVLDALDPDAVATEVLQSTPHWTQLPADIVAVVAARHVLATAEPADRQVIRTVAAARYAGVAPRPDDTGNGCCRLRWAWLRPEPPHLVLTGHDGAVKALTALPLPDGRTLLASGGDDRTVQLWDPVTGIPHGEPLRQQEGVRALAAVPLPDGRALLAVACGQQVRLWDVTTGTAVTTLTGHTATLTAVAAVPLPDGRTLLATAGDQPAPTVRLWDPATGAALGVLTSHEEPVTALVPWLLPDGRTILASGGKNDTLQLRDPVSGAEVGRGPNVRPLASVPLSDGRTLLAAVSWNGVRFYEPVAGKAIDVLHRHESGISFPDAVTAVPLADSRTLLAGTDSSDIRLWDPIGNAPADKLTGHTDEVRALITVPLTDGRTLLASAGQDSTVRLWDPTIRRAGTPDGAGSVADLVFLPHPDGRILLAGAVAGLRRPVLWDADTGDPADPLPCYGEWVSALAAVPLADGRTVLAVDGGEQLAGDDHVVWLCDPSTGANVGELGGHWYWVEDMAAVPLPGGATLLAVGSVSNAEQPGPPVSDEYPDEVRLWNPLTATEVGDPIPDCTAPLAAVPMPDGRTLLATGVVGRHLRLWEPATGAPVGKPLTGHTGWLTAMTTVELPDGRTLLASCSTDGTIRLWDPVDGAAVLDPLTGHGQPVRALAAIPRPGGGSLLASGGSDGTIRLWDPTTGKCQHVLRLDSPVHSLAAQERWLAVGCVLGVLLFDLHLSSPAVH